MLAPRVRCPACHHEETKVVDSRDARGEVRRRRECFRCGERFTTFERTEPSPVYVRKRNGEVERFDPDKLRAALLRTTSKGAPGLREIDSLIEEVHRSLAPGRSQTVPSGDVARRVLEELARLDRVAHDRFAAEYEIGAEDGALRKRARTPLAGAADPPSLQLPLFPEDDPAVTAAPRPRRR